MTSKTRDVVARGFLLPESPRWHDQWLWFSDIHGGKVHRMDEGGRVETVAEFGHPSGLGFLPNGDLLVADWYDGLFRLSGSKVVDSTDLSPLVGGHQRKGANDMVVDGQGRAYLGDSGQSVDQTFDEGVTKPVGQVILVPPDALPRVVATELMVPNGVGILPDGRTFVVAECFGPMRLTGFDILDDGSLAERRTLVQFSHGAPDGLCCDAEGAIWVAVHPREGAIPHPSPPAVPSSGSEFVRVLNGEIVDRVSVPERWPLACALGGADRRTLYMCTVDPPQGGDARAIHNGQIEATRVDVPGAGWP